RKEGEPGREVGEGGGQGRLARAAVGGALGKVRGGLNNLASRGRHGRKRLKRAFGGAHLTRRAHVEWRPQLAGLAWLGGRGRCGVGSLRQGRSCGWATAP